MSDFKVGDIVVFKGYITEGLDSDSIDIAYDDIGEVINIRGEGYEVEYLIWWSAAKVEREWHNSHILILGTVFDIMVKMYIYGRINKLIR